MADEFLNQDEIDALLSGGDSEPSGGGTGALSGEELSALGEVASIIGSAASNVVGMLAGRNVDATVAANEDVPQETVSERLDSAKAFSYSMTWGGLDAPAMLVTSERGALALADLMMGGDATELPGEANDLYLSAAQEGLSQLVGSALTNLSGLMKGAKLAAENATSSLDESGGWMPFAADGGGALVWFAQVKIEVDGVDPFDLDMVMPLENARNLAQKVLESMAPEEAPAPAAAHAPAAAPQMQMSQQAPPASAAPMAASLPPRAPQPPVDVKPVEFAQFGNGETAAAPGNIDLIVDIPVRVTVELGRTRKTIGEILAMGPGSVVELNKMAGEPVDVLVNGKLIARGEVVVIDESFGIRVTEVVSRAERIRSMGV